MKMVLATSLAITMAMVTAMAKETKLEIKWR